MSVHIPVLLEEVLRGLEVASNKHFLDATFGGGGHTQAILQKTIPQGKVFAIDLDTNAIEQGKKVQEMYQNRLTIAHGNFKDFPKLLKDHQFHEKLDGIVCDLGFSSDELQQIGMSFLEDAPLDMRYDPSLEISAQDILQTYCEEELACMFKENADERLSKKIANRLVKARKEKPFTHTKQLADFIANIYAHSYKKPSKRHPATKVFQALRIEVNDELENISTFLTHCLESLPKDCIIAMISFHSIEDRLIKQFFKKYAKEEIGPDGRTLIREKKIQIINKKVIIATEAEIKRNPRSRSAKLRLAKIV